MVWIFRMLLRGIALLLAALVLRACDRDTYSLDARSGGSTPVASSAIGGEA